MKKGILLCIAVLLATATAYAVPNLTLVWEKVYRDPYGLHQTCLGGLNAFDVDRDGKMDIVIPFRKDSRRILCVNGADGSVKWVFPPMTEDGLPDDQMYSPCIGDMDGDGKYEILGQGRSKDLHCIDAATGTRKWKFECTATDASVVLFDINGNGKLEAVYCGGDTVFVVDSTGKMVWSYKMTAKGETPVVWDVDRDGLVDIIAADANGNVFCLSNTGVEKWRFPMGGMTHSVAPIIADFNKDGEYEIAVPSHDKYLHMLTFYGTEAWGFPIAQHHWAVHEKAGKHEAGFAAADLTGDGCIEIIISDWIGNVHAVRHDGKQLWHRKLPEEVWTGILVLDFTGDGKLDVIVPAEGNESTAYPNGCVMVLDGATGAEKMVWPEWLTASAPSAGDITGRGYVEIVAQAWSEPFKVLTAGAKINPKLMPWPYWYKSPTNNAVYPIPELAASAVAFAVVVGFRKRSE